MGVGIALIVLGLILVFCGAKAFFAALLVSAGIFVLKDYVFALPSALREKRRMERRIRDLLGGKVEEKLIGKVLELIRTPVAHRLLVEVEEGGKPVVRVRVPVGALVLLRPFVGLMLPLASRYSKEVTKLDRKALEELLDHLPELYGLEVDVEDGQDRVYICLE